MDEFLVAKQGGSLLHFPSLVGETNRKQDACYTGITRDAGADSFIPTVCFADW